MPKLFSDTESDFYQYLTFHGKVSPRTRTNYISWLRFLSKSHLINNDLDQESVRLILEQENNRRHLRTIYKKEKDIRNFYFALKKYIDFLSYNFSERQEAIINEELKKINFSTNLTATERETVLLSRLGQGTFRNKLISYWQGCSVSNFDKSDILIASHIKPWKDSSNHERLDCFNGLLLLPNYDKLFDKGYISFDENGQILSSKLLSNTHKNALGITNNLKLFKVEKNHLEYLNYHYENCFMK